MQLLSYRPIRSHRLSLVVIVSAQNTVPKSTLAVIESKQNGSRVHSCVYLWGVVLGGCSVQTEHGRMGRFICNLPFEDNKIREIYTLDIYKRVIAAFELGELYEGAERRKICKLFWGKFIGLCR